MIPWSPCQTRRSYCCPSRGTGLGRLTKLEAGNGTMLSAGVLVRRQSTCNACAAPTCHRLQKISAVMHTKTKAITHVNGADMHHKLTAALAS